jgi:Rab3 GTPase-activating protein catalytic subunit
VERIVARFCCGTSQHLSPVHLQFDEGLRDLWFQYVPKKMKEQEFWHRYYMAVKSIRQEVIDGECENAVARSWSNLERRLVFGGIGAEVCTLIL